MQKVLDHGYVKLVDVGGSDERIIEAARMSTNKGFVSWDKDARLLHYLYKHKHFTPFEMCDLSIEVKAPIFVFREWHRHRTQSYNELSARYTPLPNDNYTPARQRILSGANAPATNRQASGTTTLDESKLDAWLTALDQLYAHAEHIYQSGLGIGVPKEVARLSVPVARYSRMRAKANLRNWLAFLTLRLAPTAQWEIRQYAAAVSALIAEHFPHTWYAFTKYELREDGDETTD
jgi:thymidylate synthase (FAD)